MQIKYKGEEYKSIKALAKVYGVNYEKLCQLYRKGLSMDEAVELCIQNVKGRGKLMKCKGKLYRSPKVLAEEYGLPAGSLIHFLQRCNSVEEAVKRCMEQQEKKITLWGREYASRYEMAEALGISYNAIAFGVNVKKMSLEDTVKGLLQKEPVRFEGKEYPTLVDLCTEYQVQPANVMDRLQRGKTLYEAVYTPVKNNGILNPIEYEGKTYQNVAFLCREYHISKVLVEGQRRYEKNKTVLDCFHLIRTLRDECRWPKDRIFSYIPRCKIDGKFYKHLSSFASVAGLTVLQIESYRSKHNCKNLIETLYAMQKERIPGYQTEHGLFTYSQLKRVGYSERERKKMKYIKDGIPQYPSLQDFHFEEDCMDILERWEQLFDKKPKRKREWKER